MTTTETTGKQAVTQRPMSQLRPARHSRRGVGVAYACPTLAFRHLSLEEGGRKPVLGVWAPLGSGNTGGSAVSRDISTPVASSQQRD